MNLSLIYKKALPSLLILISLSACTTVPTQFGSHAAQLQLSQAFRHFLAHAPAGDSAFLPESPWGAQVTVYARQAYFAASGRTCRKLTIVHNAGMRRPGLVCRLPSGGWEEVRALRGVSSRLLNPNAGYTQSGDGS